MSRATASRSTGGSSACSRRSSRRPRPSPSSWRIIGGFFDAELFRFEGELLRASGDAGAAEALFRKALGIAHSQEARAFELRAATSLGRLLAEQGRASEALPVLATACQAFRDGFETRDLTQARQILDQLSPT